MFFNFAKKITDAKDHLIFLAKNRAKVLPSFNRQIKTLVRTITGIMLQLLSLLHAKAIDDNGECREEKREGKLGGHLPTLYGEIKTKSGEVLFNFPEFECNMEDVFERKRIANEEIQKTVKELNAKLSWFYYNYCACPECRVNPPVKGYAPQDTWVDVFVTTMITAGHHKNHQKHLDRIKPYALP